MKQCYDYFDLWASEGICGIDRENETSIDGWTKWQVLSFSTAVSGLSGNKLYIWKMGLNLFEGREWNKTLFTLVH